MDKYTKELGPIREDDMCFVADGNKRNSINIILAAYEKYLNKYNLNNEYFYIDRIILEEVAIRYWRDVYRIHAYHKSDKIDAHKIAGLYTYWICKLKPFTIFQEKIKNEHKKLCQYVNEQIAIVISIGRIFDERKRIQHDKAKIADIPDKMIPDFLYTLKARQIDSNSLSIIYYLIDKL